MPMLIVPETATLNHVLRRFQREKRHLAIVVDEYGSTRGIITLEDVLEEIVGEIEDESTPTRRTCSNARTARCCAAASPRPQGVRAARPRGRRDRQPDAVRASWPSASGNVPTAGTHVDVGGYRFTVTKANNRRAERVRITVCRALRGTSRRANPRGRKRRCPPAASRQISGYFAGHLRYTAGDALALRQPAELTVRKAGFPSRCNLESLAGADQPQWRTGSHEHGLPLLRRHRRHDPGPAVPHAAARRRRGRHTTSTATTSATTSTSATTRRRS
jgi:hypothetical protein